MAEENPPTPAPEAAQQQTTAEPATEVPNVESMLSALPGFDQYFGDEQKSEEPPKESAPSGEEVTTEETQEVTQAPEEAETEPKEDDKESPVQKRIDKLTAQKHEALERAEKAEARVKELETQNKALPVLAPTRAHPLTNIQSVPELEQKLIDARQAKKWALENLDGGQVQNDKGEVVQELDGSQVKKVLATAEDLITVHIPQRLQYLESRSIHDAEVKKHYPNFLKTDTEEYQLLQKWVQLLPEVLNFPDFRLIIADGLAGQRARLAKNNAKNGAPAAKNLPLAAPQPSSAPRTPQKSVLSKDLLNRIATDRRALDAFSESLIGTGGGSRK